MQTLLAACERSMNDSRESVNKSAHQLFRLEPLVCLGRIVTTFSANGSLKMCVHSRHTSCARSKRKSSDCNVHFSLFIPFSFQLLAMRMLELDGIIIFDDYFLQWRTNSTICGIVCFSPWNCFQRSTLHVISMWCHDWFYESGVYRPPRLNAFEVLSM